MLSIDANILLHAFNRDSPQHVAARRWLTSIDKEEAVEVVQAFRSHPRWRLIGFPTESRSLHDALWHMARSTDFAFRRLYDARTALTLVQQGVTEFATFNVKDFMGLGFHRVWNPLDASGRS